MFVAGPKQRLTLRTFIDNLGKDVDMEDIDNVDSSDQINSNNINDLQDRHNGTCSTRSRSGKFTGNTTYLGCWGGGGWWVGGMIRICIL